MFTSFRSLYAHFSYHVITVLDDFRFYQIHMKFALSENLWFPRTKYTVDAVATVAQIGIFLSQRRSSPLSLPSVLSLTSVFPYLAARELKQPRRRRPQKPHKFAYLTMKNTILHALHVHISSFDILKTFSFFLRRDCSAIVWTT